MHSLFNFPASVSLVPHLQVILNLLSEIKLRAQQTLFRCAGSQETDGVWLLNLAGQCGPMSTSWKAFRSGKIFVVVTQKGRDKCFEDFSFTLE